MEAILVHILDFPLLAECSCSWRGGRNIAGDCNMAAPAVLHSLLWSQMVLHSFHLFQVVLNSLLTLATSECGMESSTLEQSSASTWVGTWGKRAGTARWIGGTLARLKLHGVAVLTGQFGRGRVSHETTQMLSA